jgi:predicted small secreted protein
MKKLLMTALIAASLTAAGCNTTQTAGSSYQDVLAQADKLHAEAKAGGFVWKQKKMKLGYVEHYKAEAEAAAKKGDMEAALKAAKNALKSAEGEVRQMNAKVTPPWEK